MCEYRCRPKKGWYSLVIINTSKNTYFGLYQLNCKRTEDFVLDLKYEFNRSTEPFAKEYIAAHQEWDCNSVDGVAPDAWMAFEGATFGTLSKMYKNLRNQLPEASKIANEFGLNSARELAGWLEAMSVLRNIIAHHSRLWNRTLSKKLLDLHSSRNLWLREPLTEDQKKQKNALNRIK